MYADPLSGQRFFRGSLIPARAQRPASAFSTESPRGKITHIATVPTRPPAPGIAGHEINIRSA